MCRYYIYYMISQTVLGSSVEGPKLTGFRHIQRQLSDVGNMAAPTKCCDFLVSCSKPSRLKRLKFIASNQIFEMFLIQSILRVSPTAGPSIPREETVIYFLMDILRIGPCRCFLYLPALFACRLEECSFLYLQYEQSRKLQKGSTRTNPLGIHWKINNGFFSWNAWTRCWGHSYNGLSKTSEISN